MVDPWIAPTYTAPAGGILAWAQPDPAAPPIATIPGRVEMRVQEYRGRWARVLCSNGWTAWVDAARLVPDPTQGVAVPPPRRSAVNVAITHLGGYTITLLDVLPLVGVLLGSLLPWLRGGVGTGNSFDVPLLFLVHETPAATGLTLGLFYAVVAVTAAAAPRPAVRQAAYAVILAATILYAVQTERLLGDANTGKGFLTTAGIGVAVLAVAACGGLIRAITTGRSARR